MQKFTCDFNHSIYNILSNQTRREILKLVACEHNYGSQIASILGVSVPAVQRHIKYILENFKGDFQVLKPFYKTKQSFTGYKGAEATVYKVATKIYLSAAIFPNFVHSHILYDPIEEEETSNNDASKDRETPHPISVKHSSATVEREPAKTRASDIYKQYFHLYQELQKINHEIIALEKKIMELLNKKTKFMALLDSLVKRDDLTFEERLILRAIACHGEICFSNLPAFLNIEEPLFKSYVEKLKDKGWLTFLPSELLNR